MRVARDPSVKRIMMMGKRGHDDEMATTSQERESESTIGDYTGTWRRREKSVSSVRAVDSNDKWIGGKTTVVQVGIS